MDHIPFELSTQEMRRLMDDVSGLVLEHFQQRDSLPVIQIPNPDTLRGMLHEDIPWQPAGWEAIRQTLKDHVLPNKIDSAHRRFWAYIGGPNNLIATLADMLASSHNIFTGTWEEAAGATEIELTTINWLRQLFNLPATTGGCFVSGGSTANLTGLTVARDYFLRGLDDTDRQHVQQRLTAYYSDQTHHSVENSLLRLGFGRKQLRVIPTLGDYRIDVEELVEQVQKDQRKGCIPAILVANVGATNTGAIDPLYRIVRMRDEFGMWLHADAAYGGAAILSDRARLMMDGIDYVDSLTVDPHKWWFMPYEMGCILVRDRSLMVETFRHEADYLQNELESGEHAVNLQDFSHQQTRNFKALRLWMSIKYFGLSEFRLAVNHGIRMAEAAQQYVTECCPRLQVVTPAQIGVLNIRYYEPAKSDSELNEINRQIYRAMIVDGFAMIHNTTLKQDVTAIRFCIINPRTTVDDLCETLRRIERFGSEIAQHSCHAAVMVAAYTDNDRVTNRFQKQS